MIPGAVMSPPHCMEDELHFALCSLCSGRRYGALVWFSLCWHSRGCQLCWPSQTADQPSSRSSLLSLTQSRDSSSSPCTVPCAERSVGNINDATSNDPVICVEILRRVTIIKDKVINRSKCFPGSE